MYLTLRVYSMSMMIRHVRIYIIFFFFLEPSVAEKREFFWLHAKPFTPNYIYIVQY
jgi:hypothetical protein